MDTKGNSPTAKRARNRHKMRYWRTHDKETYECPECGRGNDEVVRFEVHHKDGNPHNGKESNLVALCQRCHYKIHDRTPPESLEEWKNRVSDL